MEVKAGNKLFVVQKNFKHQLEKAEYKNVEKVGRKYFYINGLDAIPLERNFPIYYSSYIRIYVSEESWIEINSIERLSDKIGAIARSEWRSLSLDKLKAIAEILELEK